MKPMSSSTEYIPEPSIEDGALDEQAYDDLNVSDQDDSSILVLNITAEGLTLAYNKLHTPITSASSCINCPDSPSSSLPLSSHYYLPKLVSLTSGSFYANISPHQMTNDQELNIDRLPPFFTSFIRLLVSTVCSEYVNDSNPMENRLKKCTGTFISPFHCLTAAHGVESIFTRETDGASFSRKSTHLRHHDERRPCKPVFVNAIFNDLDPVYRDLALLELETAVQLDAFFLPYFLDEKDDHSTVMYPTKIIVADSALPDEAEYNQTSRWSVEFPYFQLKRLYAFKGHKISFGSLARRTSDLISKTTATSSTTPLPAKKLKTDFNLYLREHLVATERRNSGAPIITDSHEWLVTAVPTTSNAEATISTSYRLENSQVRRFHGIHLGADQLNNRSDHMLLSGRIISDINANRYIPTDSPVFLSLYLSAIADLTTTTTRQRITGSTQGLGRFFRSDDVSSIRTFVNEVRSRLSTFDKSIGDELLRLIEIIES